MIIGEKHDFDKDRHGSDFEHMNCYYGRDRGEKDVGYKIYKDEAEYIKEGFNSGEQYVYLMKDAGEENYLGKPKLTWFYVESRYTENGKEVFVTDFIPLEKYAILERIEILKRTIEIMEESEKRKKVA